MTCEELGLVLLDHEQEASRAQEVAAHLGGCEACRALEEAHRAALALRTEAVPALPAPDFRAEVQRRRRARVVYVAAGAAAAAVLALWTLSAPVDVPAAEGLAEQQGQQQQEERGGGFVETSALAVEGASPAPFSLEGLVATVDGYTRRDLVAEDFTYSAFGELSKWVAPPEGDSLQLELEEEP